MGKDSVSPLRPRCVLASGVATVFSAPARIMTKKEYLVDSAVRSKEQILDKAVFPPDLKPQALCCWNVYGCVRVCMFILC